jgi:hypothetical protein
MMEENNNIKEEQETVSDTEGADRGPSVTDEEIEQLAKKSKKTKTIIIAVFASAVVLAIVCALIPGLLTD